MRRTLKNINEVFSQPDYDLKSDTQLAKLYEAGHAFGTSYNLNSIPDEAKLQSDLKKHN